MKTRFVPKREPKFAKRKKKRNKKYVGCWLFIKVLFPWMLALANRSLPAKLGLANVFTCTRVLRKHWTKLTQATFPESFIGLQYGSDKKFYEIYGRTNVSVL